jgi:hypothetical protein
MSETVSFLGGAAIAGVAAFALLRGFGNPGYSAPVLPQLSAAPTIMATPAPIPAPVAPVAAPAPAVAASTTCETQKSDYEAIKSQVERQKFEMEQLTYQNQVQQKQLEALTMQSRINPGAAQLYDGAGNPVTLPPTLQSGLQNRLPASVNPNDSFNPILSGMLWATGGVVLCLAGGTLLLVIFGAFSRQSRTMRMPSPNYTIEGYARAPYQASYQMPIRYAAPPEEPAMPRASGQRPGN